MPAASMFPESLTTCLPGYFDNNSSINSSAPSFANPTLLQSLPPGILAELARRRWNIEKVFDELKNKHQILPALEMQTTIITNVNSRKLLRQSTPLLRPAAAVMILAACHASSHAEVSLPAIISDHMVLQKAPQVAIWGKAAPGEKVSVALDGQTETATTDGNGRWRLNLNLEKSKPGPFEMTVHGANTIKISDVVVGEVWMAGGQSNMARGLSNTANGPEEVAQSTNPLLRQFLVAPNPAPAPADDCVGSWTVASPETSGKFSAVGYYFAKELQKELRTPVGFLNSSVGGTGCEPWTSGDALDKDPDLKATKDLMWPRMKEYLAKKEVFVAHFAKWLADTGREDKKPRDPTLFAAENASPEGWSTISLPGHVTSSPGAVWLRTEVILPLNSTLEKLPLTVGDIPGFEAIYWNGALVDELTYQETTGPHVKRTYSIPPALMREGRNVLAIRIFAPTTGVDLHEVPKPKQGALGPEWKMKPEFELPPLDPSALAAIPQPPGLPNSLSGTPGFLFNGMVNPLIPYAIKGVIWYQGESNTKRAWQYRTSFPLLINDWRAKWGQGDFPFYFCQLPNYQPKQKEPGESIWAELREAQSLALKIPNTAQAVLIDIGETSDIHPRNKKDVGERLALIALARDYGKKASYTGPAFETSKVEGNSIRITFAPAHGGLAVRSLPATHDEKTLIKKTLPLKRNSPNSEVEGFAICGADRKWVWANAKIDGDTVLVWSDKISEPVAVRYAWADNPTCNLTNTAGLLASPFRSDSFPLTTEGVHLSR